MSDAKLENMLRGALLEEPAGAADSAIIGEIRWEAHRRARRTLVLRWAGKAAAVLAVSAAIALPGRSLVRHSADESIAGDGEIMLEIIGFASPGDFYAEE